LLIVLLQAIQGEFGDQDVSHLSTAHDFITPDAEDAWDKNTEVYASDDSKFNAQSDFQLKNAEDTDTVQ
jgi:hypothetical protein